MSAKILSLSKARKSRDRVKKRAQADENAVKYGRPGAEKKRDAQAAAKTARDLDGKRRE